MLEDQNELDQILMKLHGALRKTVSDAPSVHSDYAATLLDFTNQYAVTVRGQGAGKLNRLVWSTPPDEVRALTLQVANLVKGDQWQRALEQTHSVLSALPGEPGSIPMKPPKWRW